MSAELPALRADIRQSLLLGLSKTAELGAHGGLLLRRFEQSLLLLSAELPGSSRKLRLPCPVSLSGRLSLRVALRQELRLLRADVFVDVAKRTRRVGQHARGCIGAAAAGAVAELAGADVAAFDLGKQFFAQGAGAHLTGAVDYLRDVRIHILRHVGCAAAGVLQVGCCCRKAAG